MSNPVFIFDGPDGTGKTTQALLLGRYLQKYQGRRVSYFSFPVYEFPIGRAIGRCLGRWGEKNKIPLPSPENMAILYALNRLETLPYVMKAVFLGDFVICNRGPYANLFNVARRVLADSIDWDSLRPEEKKERIDLVLRLDDEFLGAIGAEREMVNMFLQLKTEESMALAEQKALSTLGGEPDEHERSYELQALTGKIFQEVAERRIPGHQAELILATREETTGVQTTAHAVARVVFSRLGIGDWEKAWHYYHDAIPDMMREIVKGEREIDFEFRKRLNLPKDLEPNLLEERPEITAEIQRLQPGALEIIGLAREIDRGLAGRGPERLV